jgi:Ca2+-binding EF-hand superfamily protein
MIARLLACLALALSLPAAAQEMPASELFSLLDRNKDGYLSSQELTAEAARRGNWIAVDRDGDGRISRTEFGTVPIARATPTPPPTAAAGGTPPPPQEQPSR